MLVIQWKSYTIMTLVVPSSFNAIILRERKISIEYSFLMFVVKLNEL